MVVSCLLLVPLPRGWQKKHAEFMLFVAAWPFCINSQPEQLSSYICVICLMYDPPDAPEEDFYGPVDHAINRFRKCFGLHVCAYRNISQVYQYTLDRICHLLQHSRKKLELFFRCEDSSSQIFEIFIKVRPVNNRHVGNFGNLSRYHCGSDRDSRIEIAFDSFSSRLRSVGFYRNHCLVRRRPFWRILDKVLAVDRRWRHGRRIW